MPAKDRPSGGARAAARKREEREAARPKGYAAAARKRIREAFNDDPSPTGAGLEALAVLRAMLRERLLDPGSDLATAINGATQIAGILVKASRGEERTEELIATLRAMNEEFERMRMHRNSRNEKFVPQLDAKLFPDGNIPGLPAPAAQNGEKGRV